MQIRPRAAIFAAFGVGPLLLAAGCGGTSATGAQATIARIQPTSFVEIAPATTTTTTTLSPADVDPGLSPVEQTYTVKANDSISKIASLHGITMEQLVNYNSWSEGISHAIFVGDVVKIPPGASVAGATSAETASPETADTTADQGTTAETPTGEGCTHTIAAGEFPNQVASQYDITFEELQAANPAMDMSVTFLPGDTLVIPPNGSC